MSVSEETLSRINRLFPEQDVPRVTESLTTLFDDTDRQELNERIHFAILKYSDGDYDRLLEAIDLANLDWRDLLVAVDFADDPKIHFFWKP